MRRSLFYCEPKMALAGEVNTWKFIYSPSVSIPKGSKLKFDLQSSGKVSDWETPSTNLKNKSNIIFAKHKENILSATEITINDSLVPQFEFTLKEDLNIDDQFIITLGSNNKAGSSEKNDAGNKAQNYSQRRRSFALYIDPKGKGKYGDPEEVTIDIKGNELSTIKILAPSFVGKNKRFDVIVRFEDQFGNLTNKTAENTLVELTYEHLRENLNWKLFIPETGFLSLPNLYFNEAGIYRIQLTNLNNKETFYSWPIKCFPDDSNHLFWGLLHGESERFDSSQNIESALRHFRDDKSLNFYSSSNFESEKETPQEIWKNVTQNVADFNEEDRFNVFLGLQWLGEPGKEGLRQVIYSGDNKPLLSKKDSKFNSLRKIYKQFSSGEMLSIPMFTMGNGLHYDFSHYNEDFERVVEIYNSWGSSECLAKEDNTIPINSKKKSGITENAEGSIQQALNNNCRFGFVAGGLDERGVFANFFENDQDQYPSGLTAIIAPEQNRSALFKALYNRSCYATTGERILLGFNIANIGMGQEISTKNKPGLKINRHISGFAACTSKIMLIEIIRNGDVIKEFEPKDEQSFEFTFDDMTPLEEVSLEGGKNKPLFTYYYVRVIQDDGHIAWSSPIWVDLE